MRGEEETRHSPNRIRDFLAANWRALLIGVLGGIVVLVLQLIFVRIWFSLGRVRIPHDERLALLLSFCSMPVILLIAAAWQPLLRRLRTRSWLRCAISIIAVLILVLGETVAISVVLREIPPGPFLRLEHPEVRFVVQSFGSNGDCVPLWKREQPYLLKFRRSLLAGTTASEAADMEPYVEFEAGALLRVEDQSMNLAVFESLTLRVRVVSITGTGDAKIGIGLKDNLGSEIKLIARTVSVEDVDRLLTIRVPMDLFDRGLSMKRIVGIVIFLRSLDSGDEIVLELEELSLT